MVVGSAAPDYYRTLAKRLGFESNLIFTGHVPDAWRFYAASDAFVFPTSYEPFGMVITEAMASGIPVITTEVAGAAELIEHGREGYLLKDSHSQEELAGYINELFGGKNIEKMGKRARETAENYSWDYTARETLNVYKEALEI